MYLTIDFEDFHHDLKRGIGLWDSGPLKTKELWNKYKRINNFLKENGKDEGKFATFFCTGIIAKKEPDLINQISKDGHEIACHYFFHDDIKKQDDQTLYKMLCKAKESLENASNTPVIGFRAPCFQINKESNKQYKIVEKVFDYDSSFYCSHLNELDNFKLKMGLQKLNIIPLYSLNLLGRSLKMGGSYLKLFPLFYMNLMLRNSIKAGFEPHLYLHPYEFCSSKEFKVKHKDLIPLGIRKSFYWKIRQNQWLTLNNNTTERKLKSLIQKSPLKGKLENINFLKDFK